jgi:hypothetical protein
MVNVLNSCRTFLEKSKSIASVLIIIAMLVQKNFIDEPEGKDFVAKKIYQII